MLDRPGDTPTTRPREAFLAALRGSDAVHDLARAAGLSVERARADLSLTVALDKVDRLREAAARYRADTTDTAYCLQELAREAAQALLSAYVGFRERVAAS